MFDRDKEEREFMTFLRIFYPEKLGLKKRRSWFWIGFGVLLLILAILTGCDLEKSEDSNEVEIFERFFVTSTQRNPGDVAGSIFWDKKRKALIFYDPNRGKPQKQAPEGKIEAYTNYGWSAFNGQLRVMTQEGWREFNAFDPNVGDIRGKERPKFSYKGSDDL